MVIIKFILDGIKLKSKNNSTNKIYSQELIKGVCSQMNLEEEVQNCYRENIGLIRKKKKSQKQVVKRNDRIQKTSETSNVVNTELYLNCMINSLNKKKKNICMKTHYKRSGKRTDYLFFDSFESEEIPEKISSKIYLNHLGWFRIMWDLIIFIMILYTILITPIYLSFNQNSIYFGWIEIAFELFFILDFFMNFITSFKDVEEYMVTQIREISMNYLMSWFTYDLLYIFPLDFFSFFFSTDIILISSMDYRLNFTLLKWMKILRIAKIFKKQTTGRFVNKIVFNESNTLNRVIKFGCIFFMLSHISSCFFVYIGYSSISNVNWICYAQLSNSNKFDVYIASLYYVLVTIYSVGYGEITPQNYLEILCIIFLLMFGSMIYSFGISSISTMFSERSKKFMEFKRKKVILKSIQDEFNIQPSLFKSIKLVLKHDYKKNDYERYEFLSSLPPNIKNDLSLVMYKKIIHKHKFFENQSQDFILYVLPLLKFQMIYKGDVLISVGEIIEETYLILKGIISLHLGSEFDFMEIWQFKENDYFGDILIQLNEQSPYEVKCNDKFAEILILKKLNFLKIKNAFNNNIFDILDRSYDEFKKIEERRQLKINFFLNYGKANIVRKKMRKLNMYLFNKEFNDYYYKDKQMEEVYQFLLKYDFNIIKKIMEELENPPKIKSKKLPEVIKKTKELNQNIEESKFQTKINKKSKDVIYEKKIVENDKENNKKKKLNIIFKGDIQSKKYNNLSNYKQKYVDAKISRNPVIEMKNLENFQIENEIKSTFKKNKLKEFDSFENQTSLPKEDNLRNINNKFKPIDENNEKIIGNEFKNKAKKMRIKRSFTIFYNKIIKNFNLLESNEILSREMKLNTKTLDLVNKHKSFKRTTINLESNVNNMAKPIHKTDEELNKDQISNSSKKSSSECSSIKLCSSKNALTVEKTVDIHLGPNYEFEKKVGFTNLNKISVENFSINDFIIEQKKKNNEKDEDEKSFNPNFNKSKPKLDLDFLSFSNDNHKKTHRSIISIIDDNIKEEKKITEENNDMIENQIFNHYNQKLDNIINLLNINKFLK